ncbi:MAG TPA: PRC-barrel domain-containing protein [Dehalococcoidia bacterium]|nr:PRC-barrel domain-containing protein [Dehalococcoidia bacterium]
MRMEELKGKPVLTIATGAKLGSVHELLLDDTYLQIAAVGIGGGGLFGGHKQAIAYGSIHGIGPDAVMVGSQDDLQEIGGGGPFGSTHPLDEMQQEVMSESGVNLGRVVEMEFEPQTGAVSSLWFATRGDAAPEEGDVCDVDRQDIVSMTEKMVIVRHSVVEQTDQELPQAPTQDRGLLTVQEQEGAPDLEANVKEANDRESGSAGAEPATTGDADLIQSNRQRTGIEPPPVNPSA